MQTVEINGKKWAVGFFWQPPEGQKNLLKSARARIREDDMDYNAIVVRTLGQAQVGFGESKQVPPPALPSLAAALAQVKQGSWLGKFPLNNGVYVIGVLDGTVLADGDILCAPDEAEENIENISQLSGDSEEGDIWDEIIETQSVEESIETLEALLSEAKKVPKVKPAKVYVPVKRILLFAGLIAVVLTSYNMYSNHLEEQRLAEQRRHQLALKEQAARLAAKRASSEKVKIERPWQDAVTPADFLLLCKKPYMQTHMISQGWQIDEWHCDGNTYTKMWSRTKEGSFVDMPGNAKLNLAKPTEATEKARVLAKAKVRGNEKLFGQQQASRLVYETARRLKLNIGMGWSKPQPAPQTPEQKRNNVKPGMLPYVKADWEVKDMPTFPKKALGAMLSDIPGLTVTQILYKDNAWTIKGELYAKH